MLLTFLAVQVLTELILLTFNYVEITHISDFSYYDYFIKRYNSPVTGLELPRWFQEVKVPRFHDNGTGW
jgi:hypothetical protein